ncbi:MAG: chromosomal replication initiator protein DnaA [Candidatus Paceibacterota bacterium]
MNLDKLWQTTLSELELQISRPNFLTWLKNSRPIEKNEDGRVLIGLANNFAKEWVENKYHKAILGILRSLDETIKGVEYTVLSGVIKGQALKIRGLQREKVSQSHPSFPELKIDPETNLHPRYNLNSFVVGSSNELAFAAASAVIKEVGKKYNPFFIYGGVGLGKTHLIQLIGNEIKRVYKNKIKVKYVPSEKFVNEVIWGIRNKRMDDIKSRYRNVDVLIIDDIHFIGGKERSEEEFFHTFNALYENNKQIIISSDRPPAAIPTLEERLRSRFLGGMIADITPPDYEMRVAIIKTKLEEKNSVLSDDLCGLVANKVRKNIREIEGILNKIIFYQENKGVDLTSTIIEEIIDTTIQQSIKNISPNQVVKAVAEFFEITPNDLSARSRKKEVVEPRQITMFLLRDILSLSYPYIGEKMGKRDHSTAIHSYEKISQEINKNRGLSQKITLIKELIYKQ